MAKEKQVVEDELWRSRLDFANRYYNSWEKRFECQILNQYYEGFQWKSQKELSYKPYVINKVFETIQIKIAEFVPTTPVFILSPVASEDGDLDSIIDSCQKKEDVLNTVTQDERNYFAEELEQAYKDSFFRFGIIEVGYAADWIINPNAQKPLLAKDTQQNPKDKQKSIQEPKELPVNERVYIKHIPAETFRVSGIDNRYLSRSSWCGYYEFVDKDELLSLKILNRDKVETAQGFTVDFEPDKNNTHRSSLTYKTNQLKIWHIWDMKSRMELLILDSPCVTVFQRKFKRLPLKDFRPDRRLIGDGFYPIPPVYHWLSPQNELNEAREQLRSHRRRFSRKYQVRDGMVDDEEIEKFETGPDGALIKVKADKAISLIESGDLTAALNEILSLSTDDLNKISGTSNPERGVSDRGTATEANIVNAKGSVREAKDQSRMLKWIASIGREALAIITEKFSGRIQAKLTKNAGENFLGVVSPRKSRYRWISPSELKDGYDYDIRVDVTSLSQTAQQDETQKMLQFLSTLTQFPMIAFSPYLVREVAFRIGYRNEKAIAEFQQMSLLMELARVNQLKAGVAASAQQGQPQPGNAAQQITAQNTPPAAEQIRQQLQNQLPQAAGGGGSVQ
jgi:hypothetical protein